MRGSVACPCSATRVFSPAAHSAARLARRSTELATLGNPQPGNILRVLALVVVLSALGACRFTVDPVAISLTGNAGAQTTEALTVTNTGDEPLSYSLTASGTGIELSSRSGTLDVGASAEISVSMACGASGEVGVKGTNSEGTARVTVPVSLSCPLQGDARLVSLEVFQGPPVYKKDFETGEEFGPVPLARPEDGSPAHPPVPWTPYDARKAWQMLHDAWSPDDAGFVTAIWRRQAAIAVAVRHRDGSSIPEVSARIDLDGVRTALPEIYRETERDGDGYLTDTVFYVERELYDRGAELRVSLDTGEEQVTERLVLFGEEVMPLQVTWIPIVAEEVPEEIPIDPEQQLRDDLLPFLPIGDYETDKGPTMVYEPSEEDGQDGAPLMDSGRAVSQLVAHRLRNACGPQEIYYGIYNRIAMDQAGYVVKGTYSIAWPALLTAITGGPWATPEFSPDNAPRDVSEVNAHEMGHLFGLGHAPCGAPDPEPEFPYADALLGPARSWDFLDRRFAGRAGERGVAVPAMYYKPPEYEYADLMSYCGTPGGLSDYNYQRALLLRQSPGYWEGLGDDENNQLDCAEKTASSDDIVAKSAQVDPPRSLAVFGSVDANGVTSVHMAEPTSKPAWPAPLSGDLMLVVLDAGGLELHRQPVRLSPISHGDGRMGWIARTPYFEGAATVLLRGIDTVDVHAMAEVGPRVVR